MKFLFKLRPLLERTEIVLKEVWPQSEVLVVVGTECFTEEKIEILHDKFPCAFCNLMDLNEKDVVPEAEEVEEEKINLTQMPLCEEYSYNGEEELFG